jgi:hypothetical protein
MSDADTLREAATILHRRSTRPTSFWLGVVCRLLRSVADDIDDKGGWA